MKALTYIAKGRFGITDKPEPTITDPRDAIVRVTLSSICTSDLHIMHGSVPMAMSGVTVGHEMVGIVEKTGSAVRSVKPGDRVCVNVETFCGECFFCKHGWVNNCTDPDGGWALGCRIDGGQTELVRVPHADNGLTLIPDNITDEQALFTGDILATGYWAAKISEISEADTVLIIGAGPTGLCTLQCTMLYKPERIIVCEKNPWRRQFVKKLYPELTVVSPEECLDACSKLSAHGGADRVIEVAGSESSFETAWRAARPNAIVTLVALYDRPQILPLPDMYGKNLTFKTGGVDGCDCAEILRLIAEGRIDTTPLITHRFPFDRIEEAYRLFASGADNVIKTAIYPSAKQLPSFEEVWKRYIVPLKGETLRNTRGTNRILDVDMTGVTRKTSTGNIRKIKIDGFRLAYEKLVREGSVTRSCINEEYGGWCSSGIVLILSRIPFVELTFSPEGLRLIES